MHFIESISLALLATLVVALPSPAQQDPDPNDIYIQDVTYNGSGCKKGSDDTTIVLSDDRKTMTVIYNDYIAKAGTGIDIGLSRRNCLLNIKVHTPQNFRFSISETTFHGYQDMGVACNGYVQSSYWFSTQTGRVSAKADFSGGSFGNYDKTTTVLAIWPQCNVSTMININSEAVVRCPANDQGQLTVDSIDHTYKEIYRVNWQQC